MSFKRRLHGLREEIDSMKTRIAFREQPAIENVDTLFDKLGTDRWRASLLLVGETRHTNIIEKETTNHLALRRVVF